MAAEKEPATPTPASNTAGAGAGRWERSRLALRQARLEHLFLAIGLAWGVTQVFLVPPLQVPDEGDHWFRAWAMTDGQLTADREGTVTLPGFFAPLNTLYAHLLDAYDAVPPSLEGEAGFSGYDALFNAKTAVPSVRVVTRTSTYGPIGYVPPAVGVGLGRLVGAPPLVTFYMARLTNLLVAIVLLFAAIRLAPYGRHLFMLVALLPMTMYELASVSCDALTISGAILFISLALRLSTLPRPGKTDVALVVLAAATLLNVKPGYWALVLLLLLVRPSQLGSRPRYLAVLVGGVAAVAGVAAILYLASTAGSAGANVAQHAKMSLVLGDPGAFLAILASSVRDWGFIWAIETIGALGWITYLLPAALYGFVLAVGTVSVVKIGEEVRLHLPQRALLAVIAGVVFLTIAVALYVYLQPRSGVRIFMQGRYLGPVLLLLLLSVYGTRLGRRYRAAPLLLLAGLTMMVGSLATIYSVYYA